MNINSLNFPSCKNFSVLFAIFSSLHVWELGPFSFLRINLPHDVKVFAIFKTPSFNSATISRLYIFASWKPSVYLPCLLPHSLLTLPTLVSWWAFGHQIYFLSSFCCCWLSLWDFFPSFFFNVWIFPDLMKESVMAEMITDRVARTRPRWKRLTVFMSVVVAGSWGADSYIVWKAIH